MAKLKVMVGVLLALITVSALAAISTLQLSAQVDSKSLHAGWNLVAIPYTEGEFPLEQLVGVKEAKAYMWDPVERGYIEVDVLEAGKGYWIYVKQPTTLCLKPQLKLLVEEDYYDTLVKLLNRANSSIYVAMFSMKYDPDDEDDPANDLIEALGAAAEKGIHVVVVLDDYPSYNYETAEHLEAHRVEVHIVSARETMHAKVVVIDSKIVVLGSHNWSEAGLAFNHEVSILIRSHSMAEQLASYIVSLAAS